MVRRGLAYAAATVMIFAVCAAVLRLAAQIFSFSSPVRITVLALIAAALLFWLRRRVRTRTRHRYGPRHPHTVQR